MRQNALPKAETASLGHTGQPLSASVATQAVYASVIVAALARICAALDPTYAMPLLTISGIAWTAAFLGFALAYAPLLCGARKVLKFRRSRNRSAGSGRAARSVHPS